MMTMRVIREEIARQRKRFSDNPGLAHYTDEINYTIETLWRDGCVRHFSHDILRIANEFVTIYGCGDEFFINQTHDLHSITATKKTTKLFAEFILTY